MDDRDLPRGQDRLPGLLSAHVISTCVAGGEARPGGPLRDLSFPPSPRIFFSKYFDCPQFFTMKPINAHHRNDLSLHGITENGSEQAHIAAMSMCPSFTLTLTLL